MRDIEIRRHCLTKKGEARGNRSHLSAEGVAQARRIVAEIGSFDLVLTSRVARTLETALAMVFAVDEQLEVLGEIPVEVWEEIGRQERWTGWGPFQMFAEFVRSGSPAARMGKRQQDAWLQALHSLPPNGRILGFHTEE